MRTDTAQGLPVFVDTAPVLRRVGDVVHVTGTIDGRAYHRVVPLAVLTLATDRALAILTGPDGDGQGGGAKVARLRGG